MQIRWSNYNDGTKYSEMFMLLRFTSVDLVKWLLTKERYCCQFIVFIMTRAKCTQVRLRLNVSRNILFFFTLNANQSSM